MKWIKWAEARGRWSYAVGWLPRWLQAVVVLLAILWLASSVHIIGLSLHHLHPGKP